MGDRALIAGIDKYGGANDLPSCVADAHAFAKLLVTQKQINNIRMLTDEEASILRVRDGLSWLLEDIEPGDKRFFFYSGHGYSSESNGEYEEFLVLHDGFFKDDELAKASRGLPSGVLIVILDSCFSGGMDKEILALAAFNHFGQQSITKKIGSDSARIKLFVPTAKKLHQEIRSQFQSYRKSYLRDEQFDGLTDAMPGRRKGTGSELGQLQLNGILLSACLESETASASTSKTNGLSAFTFCLLESLYGGPSKTVQQTLRDTADHLDRLMFRQTPTLFANPESLVQTCLFPVERNSTTPQATETRVRAIGKMLDEVLASSETVNPTEIKTEILETAERIFQKLKGDLTSITNEISPDQLAVMSISLAFSLFTDRINS